MGMRGGGRGGPRGGGPRGRGGYYGRGYGYTGRGRGNSYPNHQSWYNKRRICFRHLYTSDDGWGCINTVTVFWLLEAENMVVIIFWPDRRSIQLSSSWFGKLRIIGPADWVAVVIEICPLSWWSWRPLFTSLGWSGRLRAVLLWRWDWLYQQNWYGVYKVPCTIVKLRNRMLLFYRMLFNLPPSCSLWCYLKNLHGHLLDMNSLLYNLEL